MQSARQGVQEVVGEKVPRAEQKSSLPCCVVFEHSHNTLPFELSLTSFKANRQVQAGT